jgi:phosphoglycerol transferase MdoB-like AlkP superfamily enzyme
LILAPIFLQNFVIMASFLVLELPRSILSLQSLIMYTFVNRMKDKLSRLFWTNSTQQIFGIFALSLIAMTLFRLIFLIIFSENFAHIIFLDWFVGVYFDFVTLCIVYSPLWLILLLPFNFQSLKISKVITLTYFTLATTFILTINSIDLEYFKFTSKRSTSDLLNFFSTGNDFNQLAGTFLTDFWWIVLLFICFLTLMVWGFKQTFFKPLKKQGFWLRLGSSLFLYAFFILGMRGGVGLRPVGTIEATRFTKPENTAFVLNSAFTFLKSFGSQKLESKIYFSEQKELALFNPIKNTVPANILPDNQNVVILIMESFGNEWVAFNNPELDTSYTPFLDSLAKSSTYFVNAFANGKKSIEAVPSILASMPSLMDNPYVTSRYGNNTLTTLVDILSSRNYNSGFYHGATNGSMRFDSFSSLAGFDNYIGRSEYNNDEHFDDNWGILDEYFNPWSAKKMTELGQPFISTLFTLSSHHPYHIPENRKQDVINGPYPICASISYADYSLRKFFEEAKKQPWYKNTLFVICADHTPSSKNPKYSERNHIFKIPILFYHPSNKLAAGPQNEVVQQLDIMPTVLDLLNIKTSYYSFGQSIYQTRKDEAITYLGGSYFYFTKDYMICFANDKLQSLLRYSDSHYLNDKELEKEKYLYAPKIERLKALIQRYNKDLNANQSSTK